MKKAISILLLLVFVVGGYLSWRYYNNTYVGRTYYTVIPSKLEFQDIKDQTGDVLGKGYIYDLVAYDKEGNEKDVYFSAIIEGPNRGGQVYEPDTYLKIKASNKRVLSEKVIEEVEVPEKVLGLIKNNR